MDTFAVSLHKLNGKIGDMEINAQTSITVLQMAMEVVESMPVKGAAQKDLAIKLVRKVIIDAPISLEKEKLLLDLVDQGILASTIDLVINASRGELDINTVIAVASGCCASFLKKK